MQMRYLLGAVLNDGRRDRRRRGRRRSQTPVTWGAWQVWLVPSVLIGRQHQTRYQAAQHATSRIYMKVLYCPLLYLIIPAQVYSCLLSLPSKLCTPRPRVETRRARETNYKIKLSSKTLILFLVTYTAIKYFTLSSQKTAKRSGQRHGEDEGRFKSHRSPSSRSLEQPDDPSGMNLSRLYAQPSFWYTKLYLQTPHLSACVHDGTTFPSSPSLPPPPFVSLRPLFRLLKQPPQRRNIASSFSSSLFPRFAGI